MESGEAPVEIKAADWFGQAWDYWIDAGQRWVLFWDLMRRRGNSYIEHIAQGQPPVLAFEHEPVLDGRSLNPPVNYALVRILDRRDRPRRKGACDGSGGGCSTGGLPGAGPEEAESRRPIVIIDPRAGHGPGIGGSKQESQIGMALDAGHPVYFMIFSTDPVPGQTLAGVVKAHIRFVEEVRRRHPGAPKPAIIGNCQGGWAAALIGAERPDLVGPMVFNGSPLSYWGGVRGTHPIRYRGGLAGGTWINSWLCDLGHGKFDGAHLVANFEDLNPANTLWSKYYHVYANIDTEAERYLNFEKWWGGFFFMTEKEIQAVVEGLFIGNQLEQGAFELEPGRPVDLANNPNPVVVFASFGDNITPPQQAFNWIERVYGSVEEIRRRGQVIAVHLHPTIGHLGIFVSGRIALREHRQIIGSFETLGFLPPGLYEMIIEKSPQAPGSYDVRFVEKSPREFPAAQERAEELPFRTARTVSHVNDFLYRTLVSPWVKAAFSEASAEWLREVHPLRMQRYLFSDLNPWLMPLKFWAGVLGENGGRRPASAENPFRRVEATLSEAVAGTLDLWRDWRDRSYERLFQLVYESPWLKQLYALEDPAERKSALRREELRRRDSDEWRRAMDRGGLPEAVARMLLAVMRADGDLTRSGHERAGRLFRTDARLRHIPPRQLKAIVRTQSRLLQTDTEQAIASLPRLLPETEERREALRLLEAGIDFAGRPPNLQELAMLERIRRLLACGPTGIPPMGDGKPSGV
jgi:pimeloyl-ACP methyl ester carboxylesterase